MYSVVSLRGIVLREYHQAEDDSSFLVYTQEMGKVYVQAKSVRKLSAKHRKNLQPLSLVQIDVVRGRHGWRLTGSSQLKSWWTKQDLVRESLWGRVIRIIGDLTPIEQPEVILFELLEKMFQNSDSLASTKEASLVEARIVAEMLEVLGWWRGELSVKKTIEAGVPPRDFVQVVNQSLEAAYE